MAFGDVFNCMAMRSAKNGFSSSRSERGKVQQTAAAAAAAAERGKYIRKLPSKIEPYFFGLVCESSERNGDL
jgi:hypothetical protein